VANPFYTGTGYVDFGGPGSYAQYNVRRSAAGTVSIAIRYANGSAVNRPYNVLVNGVNIGQLTCTPTGSSSTWATLSLPNVALAAGVNTIRFVVIDAGANLDHVTITPVVQAPLTLQAETAATLGGGTVASTNNKGYLGTGYADFGGAGSFAQFNVNRPAAGNASLAIRYANGSSANRPYRLVLNGLNIGTFSCYPTGSGSTWQTLALTNVSLAGGINTIRFVAVGAGVDLDQLTITPIVESPLTLQAETGATLGGGTVATRSNPGYTGAGYADFGGPGSYAQFIVNRAIAGTVTIGIRYQNASSAIRPWRLVVNGANVGTFSGRPSGAWQTESLTNLSLLAGNNTIRFEAVGQGVELDQLTIT
jgi:hypothetical protein